MNAKTLVYLHQFYDDEKLRQLIEEEYQLKVSDDVLEQYLNTLNCRYVTKLCTNYPLNLRNELDAPVIIYYLGNLNLLKEQLAWIYGSTYPTLYGKTVTKDVVKQLDKEILITGVMYGVERIAQLYAKDRAFNRVLVLTSGFQKIYPLKATDIVFQKSFQSLVLSIFPPKQVATKKTIMRKNYFIAMLAKKLYIVEAKQYSKALIYANFMLDHAKEIIAVPGDIYSPNSKGCNQLICEGASVFIIQEKKYN